MVVGIDRGAGKVASAYVAPPMNSNSASRVSINLSCPTTEVIPTSASAKSVAHFNVECNKQGH